MGESYIIKNGLIYSKDLKTVLGVDINSNEFTGRIPYGARFIEDEVFTECPYENMSLPDSIEAIGVCLFRNSPNLKTVKLPVQLGDIPPYLFDGCSSLEKVTMPNTVAAFSEGMFKDCSSLTQIPFRAGIKELPVDVFYGCTSLQSLVLPPTVERIESHAVFGCPALTAVVLPASLKYIAADAFEGSENITNIRIAENDKFFVSEEDGCLYERSEAGDKLVLAVKGVHNDGVSFFKENVDDEPDSFEFEDEDDIEDDTFSAEIGTAAEEEELLSDSISTENNTEEKNMSDNNLDEMLADIMGEEKARNEVPEDIGVSERESEVLSNMMDCMNDKPVNNTGAVTADELANLFSKNEAEETTVDSIVPEQNESAIDSKLQILIDSSAVSKIINCETDEEPLVDSDLFVIAEITTKDENGNDCFTKKLEACVQRFAHIQDLKRIILLAGLPLDNEEFVQFYYHFISQKNVILACEAASPSLLSDYAKSVCEQSRISLEKSELINQRKKISIKNDTLIKLVIQDKKDE